MKNEGDEEHETALWEGVGPELPEWWEEWNLGKYSNCVCVCLSAGPQVSDKSQEGEKKMQIFIKYISPYFLDIICGEKWVRILLEWILVKCVYNIQQKAVSFGEHINKFLSGSIRGICC